MTFDEFREAINKEIERTRKDIAALRRARDVILEDREREAIRQWVQPERQEPPAEAEPGAESG